MSIRPARVLVVLVTSGCGATASGPALLSVPDVRASPVPEDRGLRPAVASIAAIMERDLGLPSLDATLHFYPDRRAFRSALETEGYTPEFAREETYAQALMAVDPLVSRHGREAVVE